MSTQTVAVDYDGVLHPYTEGWVGPVPADEPPMPGARLFLETLVAQGFDVVVFSTRCSRTEGLVGTIDWLQKHDLFRFVVKVTHEKPAAIAYVDDRAVAYRGDFDECLTRVDELARGRTHGAAQ